MDHEIFYEIFSSFFVITYRLPQNVFGKKVFMFKYSEEFLVKNWFLSQVAFSKRFAGKFEIKLFY